MTEATSAPNRVTWQGTCAHEGCGKPVNAKRIREGSPPPAGDVAEHTGQPDDPYAVREVGTYRAGTNQQPQDSEPAAGEPADAGNGAQRPAEPRGGDSGGDAATVPAEPASGESGEPAREPGRRGSRLAAAFRTARQRRDAVEPDDELIPGVY